MAARTKIEWADSTWNPLRGCTRISGGCRNCYAEVMAGRFSDPGQWGHGIAERRGGDHRWTGRVELVEDALTLPRKWRKPRRIFVNSTSDLFHEAVPDEWIDRIFAVMADTPRHTFMVLTKRPERMRQYVASYRYDGDGFFTRNGEPGYQSKAHQRADRWPLPNVWLGVSVEDQETADARIPTLLETPAAVRFVSAEPLLGPVALGRVRVLAPSARRAGVHVDALTGRCAESGLAYHSDWDGDGSPPSSPPPRLDWVIVGGESGPGARPMHPAWARTIRDQCAAANVAFTFKQWGEWAPGHFTADILVGAGEISSGFLARNDTRWAGHGLTGSTLLHRVGKARAGRHLDNVLHDAWPEAWS